MAQVVRFHEVGGPDVLRVEDVEVPDPGPREVRVRHVAIGVNFADLSQRAGRFPSQLPAGLGSEAAGIVEAVGEGVDVLQPGDRVAYGGSAPGSYASQRILPEDVVAKLPDEIDFETAAGMMSAGLTAGYLLRRVWPPIGAGDAILLTAAAGGVGQIAAQWAKALDLTVIGTVGSAHKVDAAKAAGCDHVLVQGSDDIAAQVRELTSGEGVAIAYDSVGADTFRSSMKSLKRRGMLVSFGAASGPPPAVELMDLAMGGSLYVTRPGLPDYLADPAERRSLTVELIDHVASGRIKIAVEHRYALSNVATAHRDIEARATTGSVVLIP